MKAAVNSQTADTDEKKFLEQVCKEFVVAMKKVMGPMPSTEPSMSPSGLPSVVPSVSPSIPPSKQPSVNPSDLPSLVPSQYPSKSPLPKEEDDVHTAQVPFGVMNTYGLTAEEITENVDGSLGLINFVFGEFAGEVQSNLYTQKIGVRGRNLRILEVEFDNHTNIDNLQPVGEY